ncbi:uncharacterized protein LOC130994359 [Salvia miltiorrhiza]|uniref:uncharacterized protein LOC130994359 n=1 Tax=Salvia miltiorrhiza TaxID=226208 RepID=UPI0025AC7947|nr:uncharacterized protein LOC130994359 [Salvia miltiorrhiza]
MGFKAGKQVYNIWQVGVVSLIWSLWNHRNDIIFNARAPSRHAVLIQLKVFLTEAANNFDLGPMNNSILDLLILRALSIPGKAKRPLTYIYITWQLPLLPTGGAAFEAELFALIIAIESAHKTGWQQVWFEADSTFTVSLLSSRSLSVPWRFKARWIQALSYAATFSYRISHIYRERNRVADCLASHVKDEGYWFHDVADIRQLVMEDLYLPFFTRVVD